MPPPYNSLQSPFAELALSVAPCHSHCWPYAPGKKSLCLKEALKLVFVDCSFNFQEIQSLQHDHEFYKNVRPLLLTTSRNSSQPEYSWKQEPFPKLSNYLPLSGTLTFINELIDCSMPYWYYCLIVTVLHLHGFPPQDLKAVCYQTSVTLIAT